jgi:hypothetical protein
MRIFGSAGLFHHMGNSEDSSAGEPLCPVQLVESRQADPFRYHLHDGPRTWFAASAA